MTTTDAGSVTAAISGPIILQIWESFLADGYSYAQPATADQLRSKWIQVTSSLEDGNRFRVGAEVIHDCVEHITPYICEQGTVSAGLDRWLHSLLCCCAGATPRVATRRLQALMKICLRTSGGHRAILDVLEKAAGKLRGIGQMKDLLMVICEKTMQEHLEVEGIPALSGIDAEQLARISMQAAGFSGNEFVSPLQLLALLFGRFLNPVSLHLYDLSKGYAQSVIPNLEGVWHTGVVVFGREYFYNGRPAFDRPGAGDFGEVKKTIDLGWTLFKQDELHAFIHEKLAPRYVIECYDTLHHNCCNFSDEVLMFLLGTHLQDDVLYQQNRLLDIPGVRLLWPVIRNMISSCNADSRRHARVVTACSSTGSGVTDNASLKIEDVRRASSQKAAGDQMPVDAEEWFGLDLEVLADLNQCDSEVSTCDSSIRPSRFVDKDDAMRTALECEAHMTEIQDLLQMATERNAEQEDRKALQSSADSRGGKKMGKSGSWKNVFGALRKSPGTTTV